MMLRGSSRKTGARRVQVKKHLIAILARQTLRTAAGDATETLDDGLLGGQRSSRTLTTGPCPEPASNLMTLQISWARGTVLEGILLWNFARACLATPNRALRVVVRKRSQKERINAVIAHYRGGARGNPVEHVSASLTGKQQSINFQACFP
ncbi:hypothetical protein K488DRAFT_67663 [Vararia minispora EC-137]|uniref:Uncharacterized protein n=1 Tax=Vararia minispora EC-137 TaxID=1314806 RepID=A0ACB8QXG4_9AGAM|nr:hypothetical protein K488DRAFT_67663 [Vararia minispora EC-137]